MNTESLPLAVLYGFREGCSTTFVGRNGLITFDAFGSQIQDVLSRCNGLTTVADITVDLPELGADQVIEILELCEEHEVVRDSRMLFVGFHHDSSNSSVLMPSITPKKLVEVLESPRIRVRNGKEIQLTQPIENIVMSINDTRHSVRSFRKGEISSSSLSGLLNATYSQGANGHWCVPSGGCMYPLDLYVIVPGSTQVLSQGIHRWNPERNCVTTISNEDPHLWIHRVFDAKTLFDNSAYVLCIASNMRRQSSKYSNLAYRLAVLEAGHSAQNATMFCTEQDLGCVECCSFAGSKLDEKLGLESPYEMVLTTLVVGLPAYRDTVIDNSDKKMADTSSLLSDHFVGDDKPISEVLLMDLSVRDYCMSQWAAVATFNNPNRGAAKRSLKDNRSFGTGYTKSEAALKAIVEGLERYSLHLYRSELSCKATDLDDPFVDPRTNVPYDHCQTPWLRDIELFSPDSVTNWVSGSYLKSDTKVWVPSDLVYYATSQLRLKQKICYSASSSGVAAHFDKKVAIESALFELIERDAFTVMWYTKRSVEAITHSSLSRNLQARIKKWEGFGYNVTILNITLDGPPVALVLIWSRKRNPALSSGASCRLSMLFAVERAFDEAEFMAMSWQGRRPKKDMKQSDVTGPMEHGLYYVDRNNLEHVEWLLESKTVALSGIDKDDKFDFCSLDPVVVEITPPEDYSGLHIIRVLSDKLVPINFGYGNEHYGHARFKMLELFRNSEYPSVPHFFA